VQRPAAVCLIRGVLEDQTTEVPWAANAFVVSLALLAELVTVSWCGGASGRLTHQKEAGDGEVEPCMAARTGKPAV